MFLLFIPYSYNIFIVSDQIHLYKREVKSVAEVAPGVFVLAYHRNFSFSSGQVVAVDLVPNGRPRLYSIASGVNDNEIEILFDLRAEGHLTPKLAKLRPSDIIWVSEPFGNYRTLPGKGYWIAAGTGVAPFVSMARSGLTSSKTLIHGGRTDEHFYFSNIFERSLGNKYIRCCSQQEDTAHFKGRLTEWLKSATDLDLNARFFLCGSAEMVVQVRDILIAKGVPFKNITSETYF